MIVLDIETTALGKNATILSLGALNFNPNGTLDDLLKAPKLHLHINPLSQVKSGRGYDLGTVGWLRGQPKEVIENAYKSAYSKLTLKDALKRLCEWLQEQGGFDGQCHVRGIDFEGSILPDAAKQMGVRLPFSFSSYNDIRTLIRDYLDTSSSYIVKEQLSPQGAELIDKYVKHIAIDDCMIDAIQIIEGRRIRNERIMASLSPTGPATTVVD